MTTPYSYTAASAMYTDTRDRTSLERGAAALVVEVSNTSGLRHLKSDRPDAATVDIAMYTTYTVHGRNILAYAATRRELCWAKVEC